VGAGALPDPILTDVFAGGPGSSCNSDLTDSFNTAQITVVESIKPQSPQEPLVEKSSNNDSGENELGQKYLRKSREPDTQSDLSYTLIAAYKDNKKRWNFEFGNEQIWQQIEPRYLPKLSNLPIQVNISKGVFGSHDLRAEDLGKPVKVRRLN
jgi:hypothetical protein